MSGDAYPSTERAGADAGAGLRFLSVYSGIGAHDAGLRAAGVNVVGQIELDPFCQAVLAKNFGPLPRWRDVRDASVDAVRNACGRLDGITGGFMCTDISVAGRAAGLGRETRSGLTWRHLFRLIRGLRPRFILIENVPALRERGYDRVAAPLERIGYALWPVVVGAWAIGAPHRRNRVWIVGRLANSGCERRQQDTRSPHGNEATDAGRPAQLHHVTERQGQVDDLADAEDNGSTGRKGVRPNRERPLSPKPTPGVGGIGGTGEPGGCSTNAVADPGSIRQRRGQGDAAGCDGDGAATGRQQGEHLPEGQDSARGLADPIGGDGERGLSEPVGESQGGIAIGGTGASCESEFRSSGQRRDCRSTSGCGNSTGSNGRTGSDGHGSSKLAYSASGGLRTDGSPLGDAGHADDRHEALENASVSGCQRGPVLLQRREPRDTDTDIERAGKGMGTAGNMADAADARLQGQRTDAGQSQRPEPWHGLPSAWPARPGEPQHAWEAPRLLELGLGRAASRSADGLVQPADRDAARLESWANKQALKALGNANPPQIPYLIGCWLIQQGEVA